MPLYTISAQKGALSLDARSALAVEITDFHCRLAEVPKEWVKILFDSYSVGDAFVAGESASAVILTVVIRAGRSAEYKHNMLQDLWAILQRATGAPMAQILVSIQELSGSQAMEMGKILPDLGAGSA